MQDDFDNQHSDFPTLFGFDDSENLTNPAHALRLRQLLLAESEITASLLYGAFTDDSLPCYNLSVWVNQEEFKFSGWHLNPSFVFAFARAPFCLEDHERVVEFILAETDPNREE